MSDTPFSADLPLAELVLQDERTARVLDEFGLPFCCDGQRTLRDAVARRGLSLDRVMDALSHVQDAGPPPETAARSDDLRDLVHDIVDQHHDYVRRTAPAIGGALVHLAECHGAAHPELGQIERAFAELTEELLPHMLKEEHLLFPYINELEAASHGAARLPNGPFGTVLNPIRVMESDHARAGELMTHIHDLADGFAPPGDSCQTYRGCYEALAEFERNLHRHVHLENNVLFPRAIDIERSLI